jgi:putative radical SAM enzyme (TIGR03279 family)
MKNKITSVEPNSLGEELGIEVGDYLVSINDTPVKDIIDYKFLMNDEYIEVEIEKSDGEVWILEADKDIQEDLGVDFESSIMDKAKSCSNKCIFCFIDQLPGGMRDTLYFKDDDSRLSFLQGNFVTLTNMKEEDIDRIISYRISPINVSVHTTDPELRVQMLNNRFAGNLYDRLKRLAEAEIEINAQIVVVPGINNGEELKRTVEDLYKLYPSVQNVAAVPIGITKHRKGLKELEIFNKDTAKKEIEDLKKLQQKYIKETGAPFVRLSDEFYVLAEMDLPSEEFYGEYDQLEDGIGMITLFRKYIKDSLNYLSNKNKGSFTIASGVSAYKELLWASEVIKEANPNIILDVYEIKNYFFGETITVAGLLTGKDIIEQLKGKIKTDYLILSSNMFRKGYELSNSKEQIMLDDMKIIDIEKALNIKVIVVDYTGEDLIDKINTHLQEE